MEQGQRARKRSWQVSMAWSRCPQVASTSLPRTRPDPSEVTSLCLRVADSAGRLLSAASQGPRSGLGRVPGIGVGAPRGYGRKEGQEEGLRAPGPRGGQFDCFFGRSNNRPLSEPLQRPSISNPEESEPVCAVPSCPDAGASGYPGGTAASLEA